MTAAAVALGLSVLLNSVLLVARWSPGSGAAQPIPSRPPVLQTRTIAAVPSLAEAQQAAPTADAPLPVVAAADTVATMPRPAVAEATSIAPPPRAEPMPSLAGPVSADAAAAPASSAAGYLFGASLTRSATPIEEIAPEYPVAAELRAGTVRLQVFIDERGHVDRVDVLAANPLGIFDAAARTAFLKARFEPALVGLRPVKSQMTIEVDFKPADRNNSTASRGY